MDLHSNNVVIGVMDMDGQRLASRKLPCELKEVVKFLAPFKKRLERVAVESTYNACFRQRRDCAFVPCWTRLARRA
jgi:hypothetical protein